MMNAKTQIRNLSLTEFAKDWREIEWEETGLPLAVSHKLANIDRRALGLCGINRLLAQDARHIDDARDSEGLHYTPLGGFMESVLRDVQDALLDDLIGDLEAIKEQKVA